MQDDLTAEQIERHIREIYRNLPEKKRRELEVYAAALQSSQLADEQTDKKV